MRREWWTSLLAVTLFVSLGCAPLCLFSVVMYNLPIVDLRQVSARKLKPQTQPPPTLHERILEGIKSERKLRPVSPGEVRRGRLGKDTLRFLFQDVGIFYTFVSQKICTPSCTWKKKHTSVWNVLFKLKYGADACTCWASCAKQLNSVEKCVNSFIILSYSV